LPNSPPVRAVSPGDFERAESFLVFPAILRGSTLIVVPKGEAAGFSNAIVANERNAIHRLIGSGRVRNLLVDLGKSNYFGSEMIGTINAFYTKIHERQGEFGVCEPSPDMLEGLRILRLDSIWTVYDRREKAMSVLGTETWAQRAYRMLPSARSVTIVLLSTMLLMISVQLVFDPFHLVNREEQYYRVLEETYAEWNGTSDQTLTEDARKRIEARAERRVDEAVRYLDATYQRGGPGRKSLFNAAVYLQILIRNRSLEKEKKTATDSEVNKHTEERFLTNLKLAREKFDEAKAERDE